MEKIYYPEYQSVCQSALKKRKTKLDETLILFEPGFENKDFACSPSDSFAYFLKMLQKKIQINKINLILPSEKNNTDGTITAVNLDINLLSLCSLEHKYYKGKILHYFIESSELVKFCTKSSISFEGNILTSLIESIFYTDLMFHIPSSKNKSGNCILFRICKIQEGYFITISGKQGYGSFTVDSTFSEKIIKESCDHIKEIMKIIFGIALYIKCFPHSVVDGFPQNIHQPSHYKNKKCMKINNVPEIIHSGTGKCPHFRSGYFKLLQHERFTKKRWQVIFVSETFVKGEVKTVKNVVITPPHKCGCHLKKPAGT